MQTAKTLIRQRGCAGWFESSLDAYVRKYVSIRYGSIIRNGRIDNYPGAADYLILDGRYHLCNRICSDKLSCIWHWQRPVGEIKVSRGVYDATGHGKRAKTVTINASSERGCITCTASSEWGWIIATWERGWIDWLIDWLSLGFMAQSTHKDLVGPVSLHIFLLKAVNQYMYILFRQKLTTALLELSGGNDRRKYCMIYLCDVVWPVGIEPMTYWSAAGRASNWAIEVESPHP